MSNIETRGRMTFCKACKMSFKITDKEEKKEWWEGEQRCPYCGELYCTKPKTERHLFKLQDEYYQNDKNIEILNELSSILLVYCESLLKKFFPGHLMNEGKLVYYSSNAVSFVIEEILRRNVVIKHSWAGMLIRKIRQSLYSKQEQLQDDMSLNWEFEDSHEIEYSDPKAKDFTEQLEEQEIKKELYKLCECILLEDLFGLSEYENYVRLVALHLYFVKGERYADRLFTDKTCQKRGKEAYLRTLSVLYAQLKDFSI